MQHTYEELTELIKSYNPSADFIRLQKAYEYAKNMHKNQKRESGEPYIIHPLEVAYILAQMHLDQDAVVAGLLHDVIEDTNTDYHEIEKEFGEDVALIVEGVTKLDMIQFENKEEQQIESLRKMFLAMAKDIRVILIKLADRLHNMRTLENMPQNKRLQKSRETLEVYAPLAHRLGISTIKCELEDLALRYLDSVAYYEIAESIKKKRSERETYIEDIKKELTEKLSSMNINFVVEGRAKHFYSIFRKMYAQNKTLDEIYDLFAVRIIVDTVSDCYAVLGMVHEIYKPIPRRFKDYIAMPKPNMYQSLHTTLIGHDGIPFEVQIRTFEMHDKAEHGIAAHWKYKEGISKKDNDDAKFAWIRQLLEVQKYVDNGEEFMRTLKIDLFADEVFVFTPKGDVISLPAGATPIDFAFAIHSAIGCHMMGAKVNSKIVPLEYKLATGDIVEVLTSPTVNGPSIDWLKICKTSQARSKINQWFKKENRDENIIRGKEALEKECKRMGYSTAVLLKREYLDMCVKKYSFTTLDDMYAAIGYGSSSPSKIVARIIEYNKEISDDEAAKFIPAEISEHDKAGKKGNNITVKGIDNCLVRVSKCCTPLPGDDIIGFVTRGRGVSVHRKDCVNIQSENLREEEKDRIIECRWTDSVKGKYMCDIQIESTDRNGLLADVTLAVSDHKIGIFAMNSRITKKRMVIITVTVEVSDANQIDNLIKRLYTINGVYNVTRFH